MILFVLIFITYVNTFGKWEYLTGVVDYPTDEYPDRHYSIIDGNNSLPGASVSVFAFSHENEIFIYGGEGWGFSESEIVIFPGTLNSLWKFNTENKVWTFLGNETKHPGFDIWPIKGASTGVVLYKGENSRDVYSLFGGVQIESEIAPENPFAFSSTNQQYDFNATSYQWSIVRESSNNTELFLQNSTNPNITITMPFSTGGISSLRTRNNTNILFGGGYMHYTLPFVQPVNTVLYWDGQDFHFIGGLPFTNPSLPTQPLGRHGACIWWGGNNEEYFYIFGGQEGTFTYFNDLWKFDMKSYYFEYILGSKYPGFDGSTLLTPNDFNDKKISGTDYYYNMPSRRAYGGYFRFSDKYFCIFSGLGKFMSNDIWIYEEGGGWVFYNDTGNDININAYGNPNEISGRGFLSQVIDGDEGVYIGGGFLTEGEDSYDFVFNDFWYFRFNELNVTKKEQCSSLSTYNPVFERCECLNNFLSGENCDIPVCNLIGLDYTASVDDEECFGNGGCVYDEEKEYSYCDCKKGYYGINCEEFISSIANYDESGYVFFHYSIDISRLNYYIQKYQSLYYLELNETESIISSVLSSSKICVKNTFVTIDCSILFSTAQTTNIFHEGVKCEIYVDLETNEVVVMEISDLGSNLVLVNNTILYIYPFSTTVMILEYKNYDDFDISHISNEAIPVSLILPEDEIVHDDENNNDDDDDSNTGYIVAGAATTVTAFFGSAGMIIIVVVFIVVFILLCCCCCCILGILCCLICCMLCCMSCLGCSLTVLGCRVRKLNPLLKLPKNEIALIIQENTHEDFKHLKISKELFLIDYSKIRVIRQIGEGGSECVVYKASLEGRVVGFKCFKTQSLMKEERFQDFERECQILSSLHHANILQFYGATNANRRIGIVMEYAEFGDLQAHMTFHKKKCDFPIPKKEKVRYLKEIASALRYVHSKNIIHRDLKPENVLVCTGFIMKLMDFGLSRVFDASGKMTKRIGTSFYMAPEVTKGEKYSEKVDAFAFGIMIIEILRNDFIPYGKDFPSNIEFKVASDANCRPKYDLEKDFGEGLEWLAELMEKCWSHESLDRPSFEEIDDMIGKIGKLDGVDDDIQEELGIPEERRSNSKGKVSTRLSKIRRSEPKMINENLKEENERLRVEIEKLKGMIIEEVRITKKMEEEDEKEIEIIEQLEEEQKEEVKEEENENEKDEKDEEEEEEENSVVNSEEEEEEDDSQSSSSNDSSTSEEEEEDDEDEDSS